jgi:hypothetical protein
MQWQLIPETTMHAFDINALLTMITINKLTDRTQNNSGNDRKQTQFFFLNVKTINASYGIFGYREHPLCFMSDRFQIIYYIVNFYSMANECIRPTKINCCLLRHRRFCVFTAALIVFTLRKKNCVCFRSFPELFWVRSVSLLIVIIVSKAFMSKACMVVSCH